MKSIFLSSLAGALLLSLCTVQAEAPSKPWAHEASDLKPDPAVVWGRLDNGMRYAVLPNSEPPNKISLRLYVDAGSLMEEDSQQGLAHFLEHMAFNGTKNYKADEMKAYFQRLGMSFGGDTNAHTSFKETVYDVELPDSTPALIDEALKLLNDYASGMLLGASEIEKERGVILSEKLARDTVDYRTMVEGFKFSMPESLIPKRLPIGTAEVIKTAPRERFLDFYTKWYTPDRIAIIAVGKVNPADFATKLKASFASLKPAAQSRPDPNLGKITPGQGLQTKLHSEKEAGQTTISIDVARLSRRRPDNAETRFETLLRELAESMLNRRLDKISRQENAPFLSAQYSYDEFLEFVEGDSVQISCKPEQWDKALAVGEQELRRAIRFGFSEAEFKQAKASLIEQLENAAKGATTRRSRELADQLQNAIASKQVFTHPGDDLVRVKTALAKATPVQCHDLIKSAWATDDVRVFVGGNLILENGEAKIKETILKSRAMEVTAPAAEKEEAFAYTDFGPPGTISKREEIADLGVTLITFGNHVRLSLKPTDYTKDAILVNANFGAGKLLLPADKPGLAFFADSVFDAAALEKHSTDDLERILAGNTVGVSFAVGDEFLSLSGKTNKKDLLLQSQLMCAYLTAPGYREEGMRQLRLGLDAIYNQVEHTPEGILKTKLDGIIHNGDPRFSFPAKEQLQARTMADLKAWLTEPLQKSYLEVAIVGDFDLETAVKAATATFGALPARQAERPNLDEARKVQRTTETDKTLTFESKIPKGIVAVYWPTTDRRSDIKLSRSMNLVSSVLDDLVMEKVREELGESYSPDVHSTMSDTFLNDGHIAAYLVCEGKTAPSISKIVKEMGVSLAKTGATADQLERARKPLLTMLETQRRNNIWWLKTVVSEAQSSPQRLDWARTMEEDYKSITVEEINALAKKYLVNDRALAVRIIPQGAAADVPKPKSAAPTSKKPAAKAAGK